MKTQISLLRFSQLLSSTPRGARLARLLTVQQLDAWGWPPACTVSESAALVVAELTANAVTHGRTQGRGFRLTLTVEASDADILRVEVTDPRGDRAPRPRTSAPDPVADPWPPSGKTVWARLPLH